MQPDSVNVLHSVTRTWNWLVSNPGRAASLPFVGRSCAQLVRRVQNAHPSTSEMWTRLEKLCKHLESFDEAEDAGRQAALDSIQQVLNSIISPASMGYRPLPTSLGQGVCREDIVESKQSRTCLQTIRLRWTSSCRGGKSLESGEEEAVDAVSTEQAGSSEDSVASSPDVEAPPPKVTSPEEEAEKEFQRLLKDAMRGGSREPRQGSVRQAPRLVFGHENGTGRAVRSLTSLPVEVAEQLDTLGISTLSDLLMFAPQQHRQPNRFVVEEHRPDEAVVVRGEVIRICTRISPAGRRDEAVLQLQGGDLLLPLVVGTASGFVTWTRGAEIALVGEPIVNEGDGWLLLRPSRPELMERQWCPGRIWAGWH